LAAMATAFLCNDHLLQKLAPLSGHEDFSEWKLPKVQRLALIYGLLGRNLDDEESEEKAVNGRQSWTDWIVKRGSQGVLNFLLEIYSGGSANAAMDGKFLLNDLDGELKDFAPETLLICGTSDPLLPTNHRALKLIREQTGRECRLVEYEGSVHGFHGFPVQWTFSRWLKDAYPATCQLVNFLTGGSRSLPDIERAALPFDYTPFIAFPVTALIVAVIGRVLSYVIWMLLADIVSFAN